MVRLEEQEGRVVWVQLSRKFELHHVFSEPIQGDFPEIRRNSNFKKKSLVFHMILQSVWHTAYIRDFRFQQVE